MRIWDLHCHFASVRGARTHLEGMARLVELADRMGIERLCVYMGMPWTKQPAADDLRRQNDQVLDAMSHWHDRVFGFAYVSPEHVETSLGEIDRCVGAGPMVGIKIWVSSRHSQPEIDPIIRRAGELKAVIFEHTWVKTTGVDYEGESTPMEFAAMAARHPDVPMICGHTGGTWELGIRAVRDHENVSVDLAGSDPTSGITEMAVRELGAERVIYGSDAGGRSYASQLGKVIGAEISDADKRLILCDNLKRMMTPILKAKGFEVD